jgi:CxxC motif-containing protein (DUF1111 family)
MRLGITLAASLRHLGAALLLTGAATARADDAAKTGEEVARGRDLFAREWLPDDPRARGGDGLGPAYNDSSCVACHNMGGPGGAGASNKDVQILSAFAPAAEGQAPGGIAGLVGRLGQKLQAARPDAKQEAAPPAADGAALARFHVGFRNARSVVLHRYGTDPSYREWRQAILGPEGTMAATRTPSLTRQDTAAGVMAELRSEARASAEAFRVPRNVGGFQLVVSRRNTPPLFGAGLLDAIPDAVIAAGADNPDPGFPETRGRVSRLKGGKVGHLGWKGQTPDLEEFVLTACSVELGLEVPGHPQAGIPHAPAYKAPGRDLDEAECASLVAFVRSLPAPRKRTPADKQEDATIRAGEEAFRLVGCAACHVPKLGDVEGLYSDLLLHDMGESLGDSGAYGVFVNDGPSSGSGTDPGEDGKDSPGAKKDDEGARRLEWRTPPLWGFRDSGPYLHDGRAEDLEQAVAFHEGQAARSAQRFFMLSSKQRQKIEAFLKSLTAP